MNTSLVVPVLVCFAYMSRRVPSAKTLARHLKNGLKFLVHPVVCENSIWAC
jgi:hypothetical protein